MDLINTGQEKKKQVRNQNKLCIVQIMQMTLHIAIRKYMF